MGFSGPEDNGTVGKALEMFPLAFALMVADMEAASFLEGSPYHTLAPVLLPNRIFWIEYLQMWIYLLLNLP